MIYTYSKIIILLLISLWCINDLSSQEQNIEKEIIIVKEIVDGNGNRTKEEIILTGEEAKAYILENDVEIEKEVSVKKWIDGDGVEHEITKENLYKFLEDEEVSAEIRKMIDYDSIDPKDIEIKQQQNYKIIKMDSDGNEEIIEWDGTGEMPKEMEKLMQEESIQRMVKKVELDIEEEDYTTSTSKKTIKIKMNKNGEESEEIIELNGDEELPEDIRKKLEENGINVDEFLNQDSVDVKSKKIRVEKKLEKDIELDDKQGKKKGM